MIAQQIAFRKPLNPSGGAPVPETTDEFPLIVKPNEEGYSMGVFLVHDRKELLEYVQAMNGRIYSQATLLLYYYRR